MEPRRPRPLLERILARKVEEKKAASSQKIRPENFQGESQTKEPLTKKAQPIKSTPTLLGSSPAKRNRPKHEGEQQEPPAKKARVNNVLHADLPPSPPKPGPKDVDSQDVQAPARTKLPINASPINGPPPRRFFLKRVRPEDTTRAGTLQRHNKLPTGKSKTPTESLPSPKTVPLPATTSLLRHAPLSANNAASLGPVHAASHMKELKEPLPKKDPEEAIRASLRQAHSTPAKSLYSRAVVQIDQTYSWLEKKLQESTKNETDFLNKIKKQPESISAPLSDFTTKSEQRAPNGTLSVKTTTVAKLVSATEAHVDPLKTDRYSSPVRERAVGDTKARALYNEVVNTKDTNAKEGAQVTSTVTGVLEAGSNIVLA